jgi:hypothetical protein
MIISIFLLYCPLRPSVQTFRYKPIYIQQTPLFLTALTVMIFHNFGHPRTDTYNCCITYPPLSAITLVYSQTAPTIKEKNCNRFLSFLYDHYPVSEMYPVSRLCVSLSSCKCATTKPDPGDLSASTASIAAQISGRPSRIPAY